MLDQVDLLKIEIKNTYDLDSDNNTCTLKNKKFPGDVTIHITGGRPATLMIIIENVEIGGRLLVNSGSNHGRFGGNTLDVKKISLVSSTVGTLVISGAFNIESLCLENLTTEHEGSISSRAIGHLNIENSFFRAGLAFKKDKQLKISSAHIDCNNMFIGNLGFSGACFDEYLEFRGRFSEMLKLKSSRPKGLSYLYFNGCQFKKGVTFSGVEINAHISLHNCNISEDLDFSKSTIYGSVNLVNSVGNRESVRTNLSFAGFQQINLGKMVGGVTITNEPSQIGACSFSEMSIEGDFHVKSKSNPLENQMKNYLDFKDSIFLGIFSLGNINFNGKLDLEGCSFSSPPLFFGSTISDDTIFPSIANFKIDNRGQYTAENCYNYLYNQCKSKNFHAYQGMFYVLRERSKRIRLNKEKSMFKKFFSLPLWYDLISSYGTNHKKSLWWIFGFFSLFALVVYPIFSYFFNQKNIPLSFLSGINFTLQQTFSSPFHLWDTTKTSLLDKISGGHYMAKQILIYLALAQRLIIYPILAVFFLAIRWNFKKE